LLIKIWLNQLEQEIKLYVQRCTGLYTMIDISKNCYSSGTDVLLHLFIETPMTLTAVICLDS
jgi:hypothetical protein